MKKLFIYYTLTGNGDVMATFYSKEGYDTHRVETMKPIKKPNFFRILRYGGEAMMKKRRPIMKIELDPNKYEEIVIGSPIWNDRLSTPILSLLDQYDFNKETTKFVFYAGGGKASHAEQQIEKMGFKNKAIVVKEPKSYPLEAEKTLGFGKSMFLR